MAIKKVMVGMSGGIDSSVAAALLLEQGYEVVGATINIWNNDEDPKNDETSSLISSVEDAKSAAERLGIKHIILNIKSNFNEKVINYFLEEYLSGKTPNPCIVCNRYIKFGIMLEKALAEGMDYIATGHYSIIQKDKTSGRYLLKKSRAEKKDQTYVLYNFSQFQLEKTLMPLGMLNKNQVRNKAIKLGLEAANKPESQEICFIEDNDYPGFIKRNSSVEIKTGDFVDLNGNRIAMHKGIIHYTVGQRKGLGISLGKPVYVTGINALKNQVILGDEKDLYSAGLITKYNNFISIEKLQKEEDVSVKIRYNAKEVKAKIFPCEEGRVKVIFKSPQRAISPGQSAVYYKGNTVLGGGIIESSIKSL